MKAEQMLCYRIQPAGLDLGNHRSETSNENLDCGVHVCCSLEELQSAINGWCEFDWKPELVVIECENSAIRDNGDFEGFVLIANAGQIVKRVGFADWDEMADLARNYEIKV